LPHQSGARVLILSASAGAGHIRAADALQKDFQAHPRVAAAGGEVQHWDILKYTTAVFRTLYSKMYLDLVNHAPWLLGMMYNSTDKPWKQSFAQAFEKFNAGPFVEALQAYKPDLVVCTHFTPPNIISWLNEKKSKLGVKLEPAIVVTDLDCHAMWLTRSYSHYFVALEETRVYLERMGIHGDKVSVTGIPVDPVFRVKKDQRAMRAQLGLDQDRFTVLVSAGGFGVGPVETLIAQLQDMHGIPGGAQVVAIAGRSEELKAKLDRLAKKAHADGTVRVHPIGFTKQMDEYMAAADILISKPGGMTTSEAMARGLPMCVVNPIPGQEERNSDHLLEAGVAIKCNNPPTLGWKLQELLRTGKLEQMRARAAAFGHPRAGAEIVRTLLG
jgi:processive 1,2-diacylglycerol beta-glucosyltransferase